MTWHEWKLKKLIGVYVCVMVSMNKYIILENQVAIFTFTLAIEWPPLIWFNLHCCTKTMFVTDVQGSEAFESKVLLCNIRPPHISTKHRTNNREKLLSGHLPPWTSNNCANELSMLFVSLSRPRSTGDVCACEHMNHKMFHLQLIHNAAIFYTDENANRSEHNTNWCRTTSINFQKRMAEATGSTAASDVRIASQP